MSHSKDGCTTNRALDNQLMQWDEILQIMAKRERLDESGQVYTKEIMKVFQPFAITRNACPMAKTQTNKKRKKNRTKVTGLSPKNPEAVLVVVLVVQNNNNLYSCPKIIQCYINSRKKNY